MNILKSPQILHLARDLYDRGLKYWPGWPFADGGSALPKGLSRFGSPDDLEKWLVKKDMS